MRIQSRLPRAGGSVLALCLCAAGCHPPTDTETTDTEATDAETTESTAELAADLRAVSDGAVEPGSSESSDDASAEAAAAPEAVPAVCTTDDVAAICEGTWRYQRFASCAVSDTGSVTPGTCSNTPACTTFHTCADWSFGAGAASTRTEALQHQVTTCRERGCFNACDEEVANIQAAEDALRAEVPAEYQDLVVLLQQEDAPVSSRRYSPGFLEDDKFDEVRVCTLTFEVPTPASGEGLVCGCAAFECRSPGCGVEPGPVTSAAGLTLEALRARDPDLADTVPPSCSTCEELALDARVTPER